MILLDMTMGELIDVLSKARSSGGERYLDTVEVTGSNPVAPTIKSNERDWQQSLFFISTTRLSENSAKVSFRAPQCGINSVRNLITLKILKF